MTTPNSVDNAASSDTDGSPMQRLRLTLRLNATTSVVGGLAAAAIAGRVDRLLGSDAVGSVRVVGLALILFALGVAALSFAQAESVARMTPLVTAADGLWVAGSIATIAAGWYSTRGAFVIAAVAAMVGLFAVTQFRLCRR